MSFKWSFSQWENYNGCPARWKYKSVLKLPSLPPGPAAARGLDMHDRCEAYIKGHIDETTLVAGDPTKKFGDRKPATIHASYIPVLNQFRDHPNGDRYTEHRLAFDDEWYYSGTFGGTASCVGVLDAVRCQDKILHIGEWKSGTPKETHSEQRKLYALFGLRVWVFIEEVRVTTYYLEDTAPPQRLVVKPSAEDKLKALWNQRADQMASDKVCAPRPGTHCRWCDYSRDKGGPCKVG